MLTSLQNRFAHCVCEELACYHAGTTKKEAACLEASATHDGALPEACLQERDGGQAPPACTHMAGCERGSKEPGKRQTQLCYCTGEPACSEPGNSHALAAPRQA